MKHIVYLTTDGVLEPIGHSQISSVLHRLSGDFRFTLISLEKKQSLSAERVERQHSEYARAGITWVYATYEFGAKGSAKNLAHLIRLAISLCSQSTVDLFHSRSYLAGLVAMYLGRLFSIPFVFDFRGFWVDEKLEESHWFDSPVALSFARRMERRLFQSASVSVSLAEPGAQDIRSGRFGPAGPVFVIPTCVDENTFTLRAPSDPKRLKVGYIGSLNRSYLVAETLALASKLCAQDPRVEFVGITRQVSELEAAASQCGIPEERRRIFAANHQEMPGHLQELDWGFLLLSESEAKRASMPTKLGEFFACGVRPIQCGCNLEVESWVQKTGSGILAKDLTDKGLDLLARQILDSQNDYESLENARRIGLSHFGLSEGCDAYRKVYEVALSARAR